MSAVSPLTLWALQPAASRRHWYGAQLAISLTSAVDSGLSHEKRQRAADIHRPGGYSKPKKAAALSDTGLESFSKTEADQIRRRLLSRPARPAANNAIAEGSGTASAWKIENVIHWRLPVKVSFSE